ncbi:MAG: lamin tail domain-containing protein [Salibacteraceae bacterium]
MIKHILLIISLALAMSTNSIYAQFTDDFTDGDFTNNPTWTGNTADFQVSATNELQLNAPASTSTSYLVTANQAIGNAQYDFNVRLVFDPSTSNYGKVYLTSTSNDLSGSLNGYYVQIGGASGLLDDVSLFYQNGTSVTKIIDGTNGTVATSPHLSIRVTRDMLGNWELLIDTARSGTFISEGTVLHTGTTTSSYFGVFCKYTSTRSTKFFFDDFVVTGGPITDIFPPTIDSAVSVSATEIDVYFNEPVDLVTSQTTSNYAVNNGIGNPSSSLRDAIDSSIVHLTYSNVIPNNNYVLTVTNVEDINGNAITTETSNFTVNTVIPANYGDIVINEIFADPTPVVGLPEAEFIEITNTTINTINLLNWQYRDASSSVTLPNYNLLPNENLILCKEADTTLFQPFGNTLGLSSWPSLNNSGDNLGLRDPNAILVDTVAYLSSWFSDGAKANGGWTLERINPTAPCSDKNNWDGSINANGGTPGVQNSIFNNTPDNSLPKVQSFSVIGLNSIQLTFNKSIDSAQISVNNFGINNGRSITSANSINLTTVSVGVNPDLLTNEMYEFTVSNIVDCYGNKINDTTIIIAIGRSPQPLDLIFNEIYANPDPGNIFIPEAEFVEIYNTTTEPLNLSGLLFSDRSTSVALPNEVLFPGEYAILTEDINASKFERFGRVIALTSWPSLNNSSDLITLQNATEVIDLVLYSDDWYNDIDKKSGGWSLELINPTESCLGGQNWTGSNASNQATPCQINSVYDTRFSVSFVLASAAATSNSEIELVFSKWLDPSLIVPTNFELNNGISVINASAKVDFPNVVILTVSPVLETETNYQITALNIQDCSGTSLLDSMAFVSLPNRQDIMINEVLFNPNTGGSDFVELYNTTSNNIDLKNWSLLYYNSSGDSAYKVVTESSYILKPQHFVVLTEDSGNIKFEYPNSANGVFLVTDLPTYSNSSGEVILLNQMGLLNDEFAYDESMHLEVITDPKGVSLERVNYLIGANTANNWHSAASSVGYATPGMENSQFNSGNPENSAVTVSPKTFTPNNDGYKDVTSINYEFNEAGFIATVTIHNDQGQLVNTLINNQSVESSGAVIWNGTNDNGEIMPTGMYIVMFRIFNLENKQSVYKNVVVLAMP